ncbi:benzoate/H(+) symporter BenE family transporter [Halalkalibacter alkalisediminis]|uniref:Benzoate/H(+) symporter BenE family transporter n=1 Tax=Halalkalibacter alkalisediminis TaxID=935616 RepID=A0ABV6NC41_9BACI|nr:benzoate/H(+) symporter BenE family transporter [Halalkalibacter alkalisediminis]
MKNGNENLFSNWTIQGIVNGFIAWLFGVTGPLLIVLNSAEVGGLSDSITTSWIFAIYVVGGLSTIGLSVYYKQPIAVAFTIPGAVLVGTTLMSHSFTDVLGAYVMTSVLLLIIAVTKSTSLFMNAIPLPIMMAMVSGVLLPFGINIFMSVLELPLVNGATLIVFFLLTFYNRIGTFVPPILGAIAVGFILLSLEQPVSLYSNSFELSSPEFFLPTFSLSTISELTIPLLVTVIAIQNAQGITILNSIGYKAPVNSLTTWSGIGSLLNSFFGAHSACIAGPMTGIIADQSSGKLEHRYKAAVIMGLLWILFGLFAGFVMGIVREIPISLIQLLAGLGLLMVLKNCLAASFSSTFQIGALFSFMITLSDFTLINIGSPFWGLVFGTCLSFVFEKDDFKKRLNENKGVTSKKQRISS